MRYDPYRQRPEKRLARYLSWQWRVDDGRLGDVEPEVFEGEQAALEVGALLPLEAAAARDGSSSRVAVCACSRVRAGQGVLALLLLADAAGGALDLAGAVVAGEILAAGRSVGASATAPYRSMLVDW